jgi:hypothetical protein
MISEMTVGQKLQAAVICLALGVSAYLVFSNTRAHFDDTVNSWPASRQYPMDPKQRYDKTKNPYDPKKEEKLTVLACADGQVDFIEYPGDPEKPLKVVYRPDTRHAGKAFQYYHDPMLALAEIKDPYQHAMAYALYLQQYRPELYKNQGSVLGQVRPNITAEQLSKESKARDAMKATIGVTEALVANGNFHKEAFDPLLKTLKEFQANQKDIINDKAKQELARKLLTLASSYDMLVQQARAEAFDKYIATMEPVLTDEQKQSLIAVVAKREQKTPPAAGRGARGANPKGGAPSSAPGAGGARGKG